MSSYEEKIVKILKAAAIKFQREKTFSDLRGGRYRYDFYIPSLNILIEIDGQFHFKPIRGEQELKAQKERDRRKNSYALAHNIPLYRVPYWVLDDCQVVSFQDIIQKKYLVTSRWHNDRIKVPKNL